LKTSKKIFIAFILISLAVIGTVFVIQRYYPVRHIEIIHRYAEEFDLEPELIFAVIHAESRFNDNAVSRVGASGLMQIMEETAYWIAPMAGLYDFNYNQIFDPEINVRLGSFYLSMLIRRYGDIEVALSAYNAGSGNVERWLNNPDYSLDGETLDHIPFPETKNYVIRVANNQRIYTVILRFINIFRRTE